jgi:hypothetical protein
MKRVVFFLMVLFAFSCDVAPQIEINPEQYELSSVGGEVVFTATADGIIDIEWSRGSSDPEEPERKDDGKVFGFGWRMVSDPMGLRTPEKDTCFCFREHNV